MISPFLAVRFFPRTVSGYPKPSFYIMDKITVLTVTATIPLPLKNPALFFNRYNVYLPQKLSPSQFNRTSNAFSPCPFSTGVDRLVSG
jgi:hypothetical protein